MPEASQLQPPPVSMKVTLVRPDFSRHGNGVLAFELKGRCPPMEFLNQGIDFAKPAVRSGNERRDTLNFTSIDRTPGISARRRTGPQVASNSAAFFSKPERDDCFLSLRSCAHHCTIAYRAVREERINAHVHFLDFSSTSLHGRPFHCATTAAVGRAANGDDDAVVLDGPEEDAFVEALAPDSSIWRFKGTVLRSGFHPLEYL